MLLISNNDDIFDRTQRHTDDIYHIKLVSSEFWILLISSIFRWKYILEQYIRLCYCCAAVLVPKLSTIFLWYRLYVFIQKPLSIAGFRTKYWRRQACRLADQPLRWEIMIFLLLAEILCAIRFVLPRWNYARSFGSIISRSPDFLMTYGYITYRLTTYICTTWSYNATIKAAEDTYHKWTHRVIFLIARGSCRRVFVCTIY